MDRVEARGRKRWAWRVRSCRPVSTQGAAATKEIYDRFVPVPRYEKTRPGVAARDPPTSRAEANSMRERLFRAGFERARRHWAPPPKAITIRPSLSPCCMREKKIGRASCRERVCKYG